MKGTRGGQTRCVQQGGVCLVGERDAIDLRGNSRQLSNVVDGPSLFQKILHHFSPGMYPPHHYVYLTWPGGALLPYDIVVSEVFPMPPLPLPNAALLSEGRYTFLTKVCIMESPSTVFVVERLL